MSAWFDRSVIFIRPSTEDRDILRRPNGFGRVNLVEPPLNELVFLWEAECQMGGLLPGFPGSPAGACSKE